MKPTEKESSLTDLFAALRHEFNSVYTVLQLWNKEIPLPVRRSIALRIRHQEQITRRLERLLK